MEENTKNQEMKPEATPAASTTPVPVPSEAASTTSSVTAEPQAGVPSLASSAGSSVPQDEKMFAVIGYLAVLFVVPLIAKPKSTYCRFHALQSFVLFIVATFILMFSAFLPGILGGFINLPIMGLYIFAMMKAYQGEMWKIPLISAIAGKISMEALYGKAGLSIQNIEGMSESMNAPQTPPPPQEKK